MKLFLTVTYILFGIVLDCTGCIKIQQNNIFVPEKQFMKAVCVPGYSVTGNDTAVCNCGKWSELPVCTSGSAVQLTELSYVTLI